MLVCCRLCRRHVCLVHASISLSSLEPERTVNHTDSFSILGLGRVDLKRWISLWCVWMWWYDTYVIRAKPTKQTWTYESGLRNQHCWFTWSDASDGDASSLCISNDVSWVKKRPWAARDVTIKAMLAYFGLQGCYWCIICQIFEICSVAPTFMLPKDTLLFWTQACCSPELVALSATSASCV